MIPGLVQAQSEGSTGGLTDPSTSATSPEGKSGGWTLVMSEEFDGPVIDEHVGQGWVRFREGGTVWRCWYPDYGALPPLGSNFHTANQALPERQVYLRQGVGTDGAGALTLTAEPLPTPPTWVPGFSHSSGFISSHPSFNQIYGFFEARMWLPGGTSQWPAFWLLATAWDSTRQVEIDVMECFESDTIVKFANMLPGGTVVRYEYEPSGGVAAWHTYGVEWTPETISWYVDGNLIVSETNTAAIPHVLMYPILNLAVRNTSPKTMVTKVGWIRVWQRNDLL